MQVKKRATDSHVKKKEIYRGNLTIRILLTYFFLFCITHQECNVHKLNLKKKNDVNWPHV